MKTPIAQRAIHTMTKIGTCGSRVPLWPILGYRGTVPFYRGTGTLYVAKSHQSIAFGGSSFFFLFLFVFEETFRFVVSDSLAWMVSSGSLWIGLFHDLILLVCLLC